MKLIINKNQINGTPEIFLRKAGYGYIRDRSRDTDSFVRRLGSGFYPRLHLYVDRQGDKIIFNLHLDQKQASYAGAHAHNAEYGGEVVAGEMARLKGLVTHNPQPITRNNDNEGDVLDRIGHGELPREMDKPKKKSWWRKLFA